MENAPNKTKEDQAKKLKARNIISAQVSRINKRIEPMHLKSLIKYKDQAFVHLLMIIAQRESPEFLAELLTNMTRDIK